MPNTNAVINRRITWGACEVIQTVYSPVAGRYWATTPRVSIGVGIRRWLTRRCRTTTSASRSAFSVDSRVRPAQHPGTEQAGQLDVIEELRLAGDQARVLAALDPRAEQRRDRHGTSPPP